MSVWSFLHSVELLLVFWSRNDNSSVENHPMDSPGFWPYTVNCHSFRFPCFNMAVRIVDSDSPKSGLLKVYSTGFYPSGSVFVIVHIVVVLKSVLFAVWLQLPPSGLFSFLPPGVTLITTLFGCNEKFQSSLWILLLYFISLQGPLWIITCYRRSFRYSVKDLYDHD